jgi:hypothetical protein
MKKYYIEFAYWLNSPSHEVQTALFDTKAKALNWYKKFITFIHYNTITVYLMSAEVDENGEIIGDIKQVENITYIK